MTQLDKQQRKAVESYDRSVFLTAGAGAGKTKVLTERVKAILSETDDDVLAITFTNRAAEEMAMRMAAVLSEEETDRLVVKTIDGFCRYLLTIYAVEGNILDGMEQLSEGEARALLEKSYEKVAPEIFKDKDLFLFFEKTESGVSRFKEELLSSYDALRTRGVLQDFVVRDVSDEEALADYLAFFPTLKGALSSKRSALAKYLDPVDGDSLKAMAKEEQRDFFLHLPDTKSVAMDDEVKKQNENLKRRLLLGEEGKNAPFVEAVGRAFRLLDAAYREKKRTIGVVDFSDLLEMATELLESGRICCSYGHILVDEFQDTNPLQIRLLKALKGEGKLFVVGDRKQSIYAFRGADAEVGDDFMEEMICGGMEPMALANNYRSHKALVAAVGDLFADKIPDYEPITGHGEGDWMLQGVDLVGEEDAEAAIRKEALWIAEDIQTRPSESRALLLWRKQYMAIYESVFREYGISYVNRSADGFFDAREVRDFILALEAKVTGVLSPAFLRTPFVGATQEDIYRYMGGRELRPSVAGRIRRVEEYFADRAQVHSPYEFLRDLADRSGYRAYAQEIGGEQAVANVDRLLSMAKDYAAIGVHGEGFLHRLRKMESYERVGEMPLGGERAIEIVTMHGAKGLEYETVYLGHLFAKSRPESALWNFSALYGPGMKNPEAPAVYEWNRSIAEEKARAEEIRLLYVAMTRAKRYLYVLKSKERGGSLQEHLTDIPYCEATPAPKKATKKKAATTARKPFVPVEKKTKPVVSATGLLRGRAVYEKKTEKGAQGKDYVQLGILFHHYAQRARAPHGGLRKKLLARSALFGVAEELARAIENYDAQFSEGEILATEVPFRAEFDRVILEGFYDQLRKTRQGVCIVDYKTGARGARSGAMAAYRLQLGLYGTAYEKITGTFPRLALFTTADGRWVPVQLTEEEKETIRNLLNESLT
ncbi:MAG: UvrD-helicase domain-containing protein [Peptoniphilus sp.]|nr:UvrD-helicase domain-containing protein [Peptoniphilus sp.]MDY3118736.1 UvrD-helicase domain-containing protein [Peptoniphilus sp.]